MKKTKYIFVKDQHFPSNGWIQPCMHCNNPTSSTYHYDTIRNYHTYSRTNTWYDLDLVLFLCEKCKKLFKNNPKENRNGKKIFVEYIQRFEVPSFTPQTTRTLRNL